MKINVDELEISIAEILKDFNEDVFTATEDGLDAAQKILIKEMKDASPDGETHEFKKGWKSKRKYKSKRYVGNTKMVKSKAGDIPLSNILEYSQNSKHRGFIKRTFEASQEKMASAIINTIKRRT